MAQDLATRYASDIEEELKRLKEEQSSSLSGGKSGKLKRAGGAYAAVKAENERSASDDSGDGRTFSSYAASQQPQYRTQPQTDSGSQPAEQQKQSSSDAFAGAAVDVGTAVASNYVTSALAGGSAASASAPVAVGANTVEGFGTITGSMSGGTSSTTLSTIAPWLAYAALAYQVGKTYVDRSKIKRKTGTDLTSEEMGDTAPFTPQDWARKIPGGKELLKINPIYQIDKAIWGSTKSDEQLYRDRVRHQWKEHKLIDDNYQLKLADGSTFDMGKDGGATLTNADGTTRRYKDIDWNNKLAADSVPDVNPLGHLLTAGIGKDETSPEIVGYFVNAVTANAKDRETVDNNIRDLYKQAGFQNRQQAHASLDGLVEAGRLEKDAAEAFKQNVNKYLPDAGGEQPQEQTRSDYLEIPEEPKMSKRRMNSRVDFGFAPSGPRAGGASTGVNEYLNMLNNMNRGRNG